MINPIFMLVADLVIIALCVYCVLNSQKVEVDAGKKNTMLVVTFLALAVWVSFMNVSNKWIHIFVMVVCAIAVTQVRSGHYPGGVIIDGFKYKKEKMRSVSTDYNKYGVGLSFRYGPLIRSIIFVNDLDKVEYYMQYHKIWNGNDR